MDIYVGTEQSTRSVAYGRIHHNPIFYADRTADFDTCATHSHTNEYTNANRNHEAGIYSNPTPDFYCCALIAGDAGKSSFSSDYAGERLILA
jgi:hypothetical protein